jgi:hypothetical protein
MYIYIYILYIILCIIDYLYIYLFLVFDQLAMSTYLCTHFFFAFYQSARPPPPQVPGFYAGDEAFAPDVAIRRFPLPAIL